MLLASAMVASLSAAAPLLVLLTPEPPSSTFKLLPTSLFIAMLLAIPSIPPLVWSRFLPAATLPFKM